MNRHDFPKIHFYDQDFVDIYNKTWNWLSDYWQQEMNRIEECINCGACLDRCPYELNIPKLLKKNLEDYKKIVSGEIEV